MKNAKKNDADDSEHGMFYKLMQVLVKQHYVS